MIEEPHDRPSLTSATAIALAVGAAVSLGALYGLFGTGSAILAGIDFNAALFEDFLGPYWNTGASMAEGRFAPAPGYVYPAALGCLIAPLAAGASRLGLSPASAATGGAVALVVVSFAVLVAATFSLRRPTSARQAASAGGGLGLAHAAVHGAYWAQASVPVIALLVAAFALRVHQRNVWAGAALGLGIAIKLHPAAALILFVIPLSRSGLLAATTSALFFGLLLPLALMGRASYAAFHTTVFGRLDVMAKTALTREGGRGAQDLPALFVRISDAVPASVAKALGLGAAVALFALATRALRAGRSSALIYLAAIPFAAVSPTWPHGLLWVPVAWWLVLGQSSRIAHALCIASFAAGSIFAMRGAGSPEAFAWHGLPAIAATLALAATVVADRQSP